VSGRRRDRRESAHERPADAEDVQMHGYAFPAASGRAPSRRQPTANHASVATLSASRSANASLRPPAVSSPSAGARAVDDEPDPPLDGKAAREREEIHRGIRAPGELLRETVVQHGERQHVDRSAEAVQRPQQVASRQACDDRSERREASRKADGEQVPVMDSAAREPRRKGARSADRPTRVATSGGEQVARGVGAIVAVDLDQPGTAHSPWTAMNPAHDDTGAKRPDPPEARVREDFLHARPTALASPVVCGCFGVSGS
jgi:hypothetical protein